ncbi:hypothetical protein ACJRO7_013710 [Eucalyptus globulus]|uniref:Uncharacterized protein n=1 Tax=Eucalyptus globulus TaxID=34317 RepID=A0ABD3L3S8_EUCGL
MMKLLQLLERGFFPLVHTLGVFIVVLSIANLVTPIIGVRKQATMMDTNVKSQTKGPTQLAVKLLEDDGLLQGLKGAISVVEVGVLEGDGWVYGDVLAKLIEATEEVMVLGVAGGGSIGGNGEYGEQGERV